jgi:hypothetical protein
MWLFEDFLIGMIRKTQKSEVPGGFSGAEGFFRGLYKL